MAEHVLQNVLHEPSTKEERIELLRQRLLVLDQMIQEIDRRLQDDEFLDNAPPAIIQEHRRQIEEMRREHEAIDRVLRKLGLD
ncbi:MAG TPA: hypothetical protein PKG77_12535 [Phycisphaerae bacterium]|nr:hypothetical protein [Phycisphaerae bacterium]HQL73590.1 hypothetical protein [Phycisphaerae bacterium]